MTVVIDGSLGISPVTASGTSASVDGMTVGRGGGEVSTNTAVGASALAATASGTYDTGVGYQSLNALTSGNYNTAIGGQSLQKVTTGANNSAVGVNALQNVVSGSYNSAVGFNALSANTGSYNSALGDSALVANTSGANNTAVGQSALQANTTASNNTAVGYQVLYSNTTGTTNVGMGHVAMYSNTTASNNIGIGYGSLYTNTTGASNTALGAQALTYNTTASNNTAVGYQAQFTNSTGQNNTTVGRVSGYNLTGGANTFLGNDSGYAVTTGANNTIVGRYTGNNGGLDIRTANNYIVLSDGDGNPRGFFENNGRFVVNGISTPNNAQICSFGGANPALNLNVTTSSTWPLFVINNGASSTNLVLFQSGSGPTSVGSITYNGSLTLYNQTSDQRLKENIVDSGTALATVGQIKVRAFDWIDSKRHETHGVIAQELNDVAPQCVTKGTNHEDGSIDMPWQVDTSPLVPMLIKAIQELKTMVDAQAAEITALKAKVGI